MLSTIKPNDSISSAIISDDMLIVMLTLITLHSYMPSDVMLFAIKLFSIMPSAENAECQYINFHYAECYYTECRGAGAFYNLGPVL
jgi:hypothetical protein